MKISLESHATGYRIHGYDPGEIRVTAPGAQGSELLVLRRSLVVAPDALREWDPEEFDALVADHFDTIAALRPEVILIGSGPRLRLPSGPTLAALAALGVGFEVMDTGAACRTYNLLAGEGRRVVAALLLR